MTTIPNFIGSTIAVVAALPATYDSVGYAALTWTATVDDVVEWGEVGDQSNDISVSTLAGRTLHSNGSRDGGEVAFTYVTRSASAGQNILRTNSNTNTGVSCRITDQDGQVSYYSGVVANVRDAQRVENAYKGQSGVFRVNTPTVRA